MRQVLFNEICKERPNKSALGAFNRALGGGASLQQAQTAAENAPAESKKSNSEKKYGLQPDGSFIASNMKQFGPKVEAMASQKNPGSVILKNRDGSTRIKVEKNGTLYTVTRRYSDKDVRRHNYHKKEFEQNYNWYLG